MKVWNIKVSGVSLGALVDKSGSLDASGALAAWNAVKGPGYAGDSAEPMQFVEA